MIPSSSVPSGTPPSLGGMLRVKIVIVPVVRRLISLELSTDGAPMTPEMPGNFGLVQAELRHQENIASLTRAKMRMGHRGACFVDGLDNLNLTQCLVMSHLRPPVAIGT
nr:hypothetical protein [Salinisphaera sp. Q1T1-3]